MKASRWLTPLAPLVVAVLANACSTATSDEANSSASSITNDERTVTTVGLDDWAGQLGALRRREHDVAGVDIDAREVDLVITRGEASALARDGFRIVKQTRVPEVDVVRDQPGYHDPASVAATLQHYATQFPNLATVSTIGSTTRQQPIVAIKITSSVPAPATGKPVILFNGAHHARELMSVEVPIDTIDTLLNGYGTDPKITHWVDANEIWVIPMLNVDGSEMVWTEDTMWRKNAHGCPSGACARHSGVDINRNYPYLWNSCNGSSASPSADDYHGTAAASEPETNAMMGFVGKVRPVFDISYHSYSEVVLYPYGCQGQHVPTQAIMSDIANKMAAALPTDEGARHYRPGTPWELLYSADGGDMDWMYHEYSVAAFAIEINSTRQGFRPAYDQWRTKTVTKMRAAWQLLLDRLDASAVRGIAKDANGNVLTGATVTLAPSSGTAPTQTRAVNPDGSFHVVTLPGSYKLTVTATGHGAFTQDVTVGDTRVDVAAIALP